MLSFGEKLKSEREQRDATLEQIAETSGIKISFLEALEHNDFEALPGRNFGKLYIRVYAEVLGFDPEPLIADYDHEHVRRRREALAAEATPTEPAPDESAAEGVEEEEPEPVEVQQETPAEVPAEEPAAFEAEPELLDPATTQAGTKEISRRNLVTAAILVIGLVIVVGWIYLTFVRGESPADEPLSTPASSGTVPHDIGADPAAPAVEPEVQQTEAEPTAETRPASRLSVTEFGVGRRIVNRRLVETGDRFEEGAVVWFSTRVIGGEPGIQIRHVWLREGKPVQRVDLELGGSHWRTHSRKTLWGVGPWTVEARDASGQVLARASFTCVADAT